MIYISGTLKIRKILSLGLPPSEILPGISEFPKFPINLQEIDSFSFPQPRPIYYSSSPPKVNKKYYYKPKKNIFQKPLESLNEIKSLKKEYNQSVNLEGMALFNNLKPYQRNEKEINRKITHNHSGNMIEYQYDDIEESIDIDKGS